MNRFPGTDGYELQAPLLIPDYDRRDFCDVNSDLIELLKPQHKEMLDIGAGSGRDALGFAELGYEVTAVEPTVAMRQAAMAKPNADRIHWVDDGLPQLASLNGQSFDFILINAVWMHLNEGEREMAFPNVAALLKSGGLLSLSLRHGPVPPKRRMFTVEAEEVIEQAKAAGLLLEVFKLGMAKHPDKRANGVSWTRLIFQAP